MRHDATSLVRALGTTRLGGRAGRAVYAALAHGVARALLRLRDVVAVYATGSLLGPETLSPGHSDIDLVVIIAPQSAARELGVRRALRKDHSKLSVLGNLFYGLDPITLDELPFHRAFGTASALELDQTAVCLAGEPAWTRPALRPPREVAIERFTQAVRRWVNGAGLLLDPRVRMDASSRLRSVDRLLGDIAFAWLGQPRHQPLSVLARELEARGIPTPFLASPGALRDKLAAGLSLLDRFARELAPEAKPWALVSQEPPLPGRQALARLGDAVLGGPLSTLSVYRRAPSLDDWVPAVVTSSDADPTIALATWQQALATAPEALAALHPELRRPVVMTPAMWRAAAFFDPAPFAGASVGAALVAGAELPRVCSPSADDLAALVRARTVESFTLLSVVGLRGARDPGRMARDIERRYGRLIPALRAAEGGSLDTGPSLLTAPLPETEEAAVELHRAWRAERCAALRPLLAGRLPGS